MPPDAAAVRAALDRVVHSAAPRPADIETLLGARGEALRTTCKAAEEVRDQCFAEAGRPRAITFSKKVFIPVTNLCRDVCHYCVFVETPARLRRQKKDYYMSPERVIATAVQGAEMGCKEALLTLGDRPEERWPEARAWLDEHGYASTIHYVAELAQMILDRTGMLPHANPGVMSIDEMRLLREVSPSLGMMLETTSVRLWEERGMPHFGSPDKNPAVRLRALLDAGALGIPFTTGMLIGIGETLAERAETILTLRDLHLRYGNLQEIIVQNFLPKTGTALGRAARPSIEEHLATIATARLVLGAGMHIQAPPNLSDKGHLVGLIAAGIDDWGGISPLTADHINPERPWPQLSELARLTESLGFELRERLTVYPEYARDPWVRPSLRRQVTSLADEHGLARRSNPAAASAGSTSAALPRTSERASSGVSSQILDALLLARTEPGALSRQELECLLRATGEHLDQLCSIADDARRYSVGECITFVRNHAISLDRNPIQPHELGDLAAELHARGVTELCLQGLPPGGASLATALEFVTHARASAPGLHLHAFRPTDVFRMSESSDRTPAFIYAALRDAGVRTVTGTGVKLLDEDWRRDHAPDDLPVPLWLRTLRSAHELGLVSTSVLVASASQSSRSVVQHLVHLRDLQRALPGFTEFIPMPLPRGIGGIVNGRSRMDETRALVALSRIVLSGEIPHIQVAWPRIPREFVLPLLQSGADDIGGTLESADGEPRAPGPSFDRISLPDLAKRIGRPTRQRTTSYSHPTVSSGAG
ncbi:7,8-didemethyl-8-hydroxy-5-deazariboflavin synthase CofG [Leucobacter weissii]|uniref:7,8-didemethyl-8-hydroxy-5-deazariboflavin synthase n=1 Tax=Leucobacter weissii TaxID=1983706 RepID=A0A939SBJ2_9MICO|nr:7,8-didemethyl-8-hydroxy-5-deazariboflavin synthase CofG [Leucobacter weissii]MBO1901423.1 7,8-didemethyl-8-hydroxy-5-deazariboflavin synthase CofG [Leucobacter weissii]